MNRSIPIKASSTEASSETDANEYKVELDMPAACGDKWEGTHDYQGQNRDPVARRWTHRRGERRQTGLLREHPNEASLVPKRRWAGVYQFVVGRLESVAERSETKINAPMIPHGIG